MLYLYKYSLTFNAPCMHFNDINAFWFADLTVAVVIIWKVKKKSCEVHELIVEMKLLDHVNQMREWSAKRKSEDQTNTGRSP